MKPVIIYHRLFEKQLARMHDKLIERFYLRQELWLEHPHHPLLDDHALQGVHRYSRSFRITGDIRVIYERIGDIAYFKQIGSHAELYGS